MHNELRHGHKPAFRKDDRIAFNTYDGILLEDNNAEVNVMTQTLHYKGKSYKAGDRIQIHYSPRLFVELSVANIIASASFRMKQIKSRKYN